MPPEEGSDIEVGPLKLRRVPARWMGFALAVTSVVVLAWAYDKYVTPSLVSARAANEALQQDVNEYGLHIAEVAEITAELMNDMRGRLTVQRYADGCVLLARAHQGKVRTKLIRDIDRDEHRAALSDLFTVFAASRSPQCLNPHPGQFRTWYGNRDGCWIEVWRQWPDSCQHVQMFNSCGNYWDSNQNGSPRVRWTRCVH